MSDPVLSVSNLHKRYGDTQAVDGVSFTVGRNEIVPTTPCWIPEYRYVGHMETGPSRTGLPRRLNSGCRNRDCGDPRKTLPVRWQTSSSNSEVPGVSVTSSRLSRLCNMSPYVKYR